MKKTVFVDSDGVLTNFDRLAVEVINKTFHSNHSLDHTPSFWDYEELIPLGKSRDDWWKNIPYDWPADLEIYPGAKDLLTTLCKHARVVILTKLNSDVISYRQHNFHKHILPYHEMFSVEYNENKSEVINALWNQNEQFYFIDDSSDNTYDAVTNTPLKGEEVVLVGYPHNVVHFHSAIRSNNRVDAYKLIIEKVRN